MINEKEEFLAALGQFALHNGILTVKDNPQQFGGGKVIHVQWPDAKAKHWEGIVPGYELEKSKISPQQLLGMKILEAFVKIDQAFGS